MKIKINESHLASWQYINTPVVNLYEGKVITYRQSSQYGYRYTIIDYHGAIYLTQALYEPMKNTESISVHLVHSINDAKAVIEAMIQMNKSLHKPIKQVEVDA